MKKCLMIVGAAIMSWCAIADTWTDPETGIEWTYTIREGAAIIGTDDVNQIVPAISALTTGTITIPSTLGGCTVTRIGHWAFYGCSGIASITIPSGVTSIGTYAFWKCYLLDGIFVSKSNGRFTSVDGVLFSKAKTEVVACPEGKSGHYEIPSGVTSIGASAFRKCVGLKSVTIPSSVTSIGGGAFDGCSGLASITIPSGVTSIGAGAFTGCYLPDGISVSKSNGHFTSVGGVLFNKAKTEVVACPGGKGGHYEIPSGVTSIGAGAFAGCSWLTGVTIPSGVTSIGVGAFSSCIRMTAVTIPSCVTSIGGYAFAACSGLKSVTIPSGVTSIEFNVFYGCSGLTSITIPSGVTSIGMDAFDGCSCLSSVTIPSGVTSIGERAFSRCDRLMQIDFPGAPPKGVGNASFKYDALVRYNVKFESEWLLVINRCNFSNAVPYTPTEEAPTPGPSENYFLVTFDAVDGNCATASLEVEKGSSVGTLPSAVRDGYDFLGWFTSANGGTKITTSTKVNADVTYYAHWERKVSVYEDYLYVGSDGSIETDNGENVLSSIYDFFYIDSGSQTTITVSGLPTGLKYDKNSGMVTGQTKKAGVYYVSCSVKNKFNYQMSAMLKWTVGGASDGDYDNIGLADWAELDALDDLYVGRPFEACGFSVKSVSGLPTGLKFVKGSICSGGVCTECGDFIMGTPTKAGKFKITFTDSSNRKTVKTVIVRDGGSVYVSVNVGDEYSGRGTVSGGGLKKAGATVSLSARPASGYYFAGWYTDADCTEEFWEGKSGDYRTASESFMLNTESVPELYARFVSKYEDSQIDIYADDTWNVNTEYGSDTFWFDVYSETVPKVTAKGLPTGVKLSGLSLVIGDTSKLKPGTSVVTLTAKNLSGAITTKDVRIVIPNLRSDVFEGLEYDGVAYTYVVGDNGMCFDHIGIGVRSGWSVTASGVPSGLKFNYNSNGGYAYFSGIATKAGVYTGTLTAKKGSQTEKATFTLEVLPFPFVGGFSGVLATDPSCSVDTVEGTFSMTISTVGKVSVKVSSRGKNYSFSGNPCTDGETARVDLFDAKGNTLSVSMYPSDDGTGVLAVGGVLIDGNDYEVFGRMNTADTDAELKVMVDRLVKMGKIPSYTFEPYDEVFGSFECPICIVYPGYAPNVNFKVSAKGTVKASGKINGRSVSGTGTLWLLEDGSTFEAYFYEYDSSKGKLAYRVEFNTSGIGYGSSGIAYRGEWYEDCDVCHPSL